MLVVELRMEMFVEDGFNQKKRSVFPIDDVCVFTCQQRMFHAEFFVQFSLAFHFFVRMKNRKFFVWCMTAFVCLEAHICCIYTLRTYFRRLVQRKRNPSQIYFSDHPSRKSFDHSLHSLTQFLRSIRKDRQQLRSLMKYDDNKQYFKP